MFSYILKAPGMPRTAETDEFFKRFCETPGLLYAFDLLGSEDPEDAMVVAVWQDRESAERYLSSNPLRQQVDAAIPQVTRTRYEVIAAKVG